MERKFFKKHNSSLTPRAKQLRANMTKEERRLWYCFLRGYPIRILRQKVIGNYIVDFYCSKVRLAIEIDGDHHYQENQSNYDKARTQKIRAFGVDIIRFSNLEVMKNFEGVCTEIDNEIKARLAQV